MVTGDKPDFSRVPAHRQTRVIPCLGPYTHTQINYTLNPRSSAQRTCCLPVCRAAPPPTTHSSHTHTHIHRNNGLPLRRLCAARRQPSAGTTSVFCFPGPHPGASAIYSSDSVDTRIKTHTYSQRLFIRGDTRLHQARRVSARNGVGGKQKVNLTVSPPFIIVCVSHTFSPDVFPVFLLGF